MNETIARYLKATNDTREIVPDPAAGYFGARVDDRSLVPWATRGSERSTSRTGSASASTRPHADDALRAVLPDR
jgi:hypothetical protein